MSDSNDALVIPVRSEGTAATSADIDRVVASIERLGQGTQKSDEAGQKSLSTWQRLSEAAKKAGETYTYVVGALTDLANKVGAAVNKIAAMSSEQAALDTSTARLGINLNTAADAAGRFTDETEVMDAANRLSAAGLHLTQDAMNELTARAAITSQTLRVDMRTAFDMVTTGVISGSERALRPFGRDMANLGGSTHTAQERLDAFVTTTRGMPRATDDAATSMARFRDSIDDAERTMAASFTAEIFRLHQISEATRGVTHDTEDSTHQLRAFGETAARVALQAANGIGAIVGEVVAEILHVVGVAAVQISQLNALAHGELPGSAASRARVDAANREWLGAGSAAAGARSFADDRVAALNALDADTGATAGRGAVRSAIGMSPEARARAIALGDQRMREGGALQANAIAAADRRHGGGGGGHRAMSRAQLSRIADKADANAQYQEQQELERAFATPAEPAGPTGDAAWINGTDWRAKQQAQREGAEASYAAQRAAQLAAGAGTDPMQQRAAQAAAQREQQQLDQRYQMQRTFTDRWEELHSRQTSAAEHAAAGISAAFESMGKAIGDHVQALIEGRENVGQALQGMAADTLMSIGKQAVAKGGMEIAEGIAAAAGIVTAPLAAGHFAAGAAFLAVGAAAGLAGAAIAPSAPSASAGSAAPSRETVVGSGYNGQTVGPPTLVQHFYAPVFGGREGTNAEVGDHMNRFTRASDARLQRERD